MSGFTSFEEALAPAFWGFPPALVLEMVGSLLMTLPFMGALAPRRAAPRIPVETLSPGDAMSRRLRDLPAPPDRGHQTWARPAKPATPPVAPMVATIVSAVPPPVAAVAPAIEEPPVAAPTPITVHAAHLSGTNGAPPDIAVDSVEAVPDFRQALSELFEAGATAPGTQVEEIPEPATEPSSEEASPHLSTEATAWAVPEATTAPPLEAARATPEAGESRAASAVVRIPFDRVVGQLPPGVFRVPLLQVGARLREAETLLVAQALIVPQLGEGVVQVEWEAVAEQFPAAVFAVPPAEVRERIVNGRLLLPLDEIVKQLAPDVFGVSMGRGPVAVPGIESFPAPFKPLGWEEPSPSPAASVAGPLTEPGPLSIEVPSDAEVAEDLKWTPPTPDTRLDAPADVIELPAIEPLRVDLPPAEAVSLMDSASEHSELVDDGEPPAAIDLDRARETETMTATATAPLAAESMPEAAVEPERSDPTAAVEPAPVEPVIRIPFERVMVQLPPGAFRVPLPQVSARLREADALLVTQALIVPQLGEGAVHVAWDAVVEQFPAELFAMAPVDVRDLIEEGRLSLPLDEIVRQLPPEVFGAAMARGPVQVPGIESFPAPFKPLGHEESAAAVAEPALPQPAAAPVPAEPAIEVAVAACAPSEAAIEVAVPEASVPRPVPVAPLYEAQAFERPVPFEPPVATEPPEPQERPDHAERIAALVAPLEAAALDEARVGDFTIIGVSTAGMAGGAVTARRRTSEPCHRPRRVAAHRAGDPARASAARSCSRLSDPDGAADTVLAVRHAIRTERWRGSRCWPAAPPPVQALGPLRAPARGGAPFARLVATETPPTLAASAEDLTTLGPLAAQSYREPASGAVVHCLRLPGHGRPPIWRRSRGSWLRPWRRVRLPKRSELSILPFSASGSMRVEIRRLPSAAGPAPVLVVGGVRHGPAGARAPAGRTDGGTAQRGLRDTMAIINYAQKVINFKVVYYGPGVAGKTANLQHIHKSLPDRSKGELISLAAGDDRTLFFDFLPVSATDRARLHGQVPALHGAGAGVLQHDAQARAARAWTAWSSSPTRSGTACARTSRASATSRKTCASTTTTSTRCPT